MVGEGSASAGAGRRRAAAIAGHRGDVAAARAALADPDASVRATALAALARSDALTDDELAAALRSDDAPVRRRAAAIAANYPRVALLSLLDDADALVAEAAAWAFGERGDRVDRVAVERLSTMALSHEEPLCRESAVAALGAIGDPRGLPAILRACGDKPAIRRRAVLALAPFEGPDVEAAIDAALTDRDWQVRQAAEDLRRPLS